MCVTLNAFENWLNASVCCVAWQLPAGGLWAPWVVDGFHSWWPRTWLGLPWLVLGFRIWWPSGCCRLWHFNFTTGNSFCSYHCPCRWQIVRKSRSQEQKKTLKITSEENKICVSMYVYVYVCVVKIPLSMTTEEP